MADDPVPKLKAQVGAELEQYLTAWRRADIATVMHADPARVSDLRNGRLDRFSLETLLRYARRLGYAIELRLTARGADRRRR